MGASLFSLFLSLDLDVLFPFYDYSYNSDGLSLLDVAVLTNNMEMVKLLTQYGAREGMECKPFYSFVYLSSC